MNGNVRRLAKTDSNTLENPKNIPGIREKFLERKGASGPNEFATRGAASKIYCVADQLGHIAFVQVLFRLFALALIPLASSSCATKQYMGISFKPGVVTQELQQIARQAQAGDKQAQLELGIRYEEGREVPIDLKRAVDLYALAATDRGGTIWVYVPSPGNRVPARVMPVDTGAPQAGLNEAKDRLQGILSR